MGQGGRIIYGVIHLTPLPGTPYYGQGFEQTLDTAARSARALERGGASGCLIQTGDRVYRTDDSSDPARIVALGLVVHAVVNATGPTFRVGVQVMYNSIETSLAIAKVTGGSFVRAVALVGATNADHGEIRADPYRVITYRRSVGAGDIQIIADIATIHHRDARPLAELAHCAYRVGADAVTVGDPDELQTTSWVAEVRAMSPMLPIFIAGHTNHANAARLLAKANGAFVGTCFESAGWGSAIDEDRVKTYMETVRDLPPVEL